MSAEDRFWAKTNRDGPAPSNRPSLGPCWLWIAAQKNKGYGGFGYDGRVVLAHRFAYELLVGPIPAGLELDHLCRTPLCVRPSHLEPVTRQENVRRSEVGRNNRKKTHCPQGHPYDAANTRWRPTGGRTCRTCCRNWMRARRAAQQGVPA